MNNLIRLSSNFINKAKTYNNSRLLSQYKIVSNRTFATKNVSKDEEAEEDNSPIKYTTSPAYKWSAETSRTGVLVPRLWYEPHVIIGSLFIFMVYFFYLREENHIDKELEKTLYSRISGLEEVQLKVSLEHNKTFGKSTADIEARLQEIAANKT